MAGGGAAALEMGEAHVSGGPCGERTQDRYAGTETESVQVGGLSCMEARREESGERSGGGIYLGDKSNGGRGRQGGRK